MYIVRCCVIPPMVSVMRRRIVSHFMDIPSISRLMIMPIMGLVWCWVVASFARLIMSSSIPIIRFAPKIMFNMLYARGLYSTQYTSILNHLISMWRSRVFEHREWRYGF